MAKQEENKVVTLCGVQGCCPTVEFTGDGVVLRDDFDGKVQLNANEWADLVTKVKAGELA